jgi:hypothetical protein
METSRVLTSLSLDCGDTIIVIWPLGTAIEVGGTLKLRRVVLAVRNVP